MTGPGPVRRRKLPKGSGAALRSEILTAAEHIFVRDGYEGASVRKIAAEVGVSSTALYMHFDGKGQILCEIAARAVGELIAKTEALAAEPSTSIARVRAMIGAYVQFALDHPNAYQLVFGQPLHLSVAQLAHIEELGQRCYAPFLAAIAAAFEESGVTSTTPDLGAQIAWATAHGVTSLQITKPNFQWEAEPRALCEAAVDALFGGRLVWGAHSRRCDLTAAPLKG